MSEHLQHPERLLAWDACRNVRDVGGYPTADSGTIRWRALVRADNLCRLTPQGCEALAAYGVRTIIDLRQPAERGKAPHPFAEARGEAERPAYIPINLEGEAQASRARNEGATTMAEIYTRNLDACQAEFAEVVTAVARAPQGGVLLHCHAGKDRTGVSVALLLSLAGVPRDLIVADYALSDSYLQPLYAEILAEVEDAGRREYLRGWLHARPEAMRESLAWLDERYDGAEAYLRRAGVSSNDLVRVRERLVESGRAVFEHMSSVARAIDLISVAEYLELEASSPVKHEYVHGVLRAFAGGTRRHNAIAANVIAALRAATGSGPCVVYPSDMQIGVAKDVYYYPDVSVVCDHTGDTELRLTKPSVLVEVLSHGTTHVDRREKLANYQRIASLRNYLIVSQHDPWVEHHWRDEDGAWQQETLVRSGTLHIACLNLDLTLATMYAALPPPVVPGSAEPTEEP